MIRTFGQYLLIITRDGTTLHGNGRTTVLSYGPSTRRKLGLSVRPWLRISVPGLTFGSWRTEDAR
jgi:hypothetical protein